MKHEWHGNVCGDELTYSWVGPDGREFSLLATGCCAITDWHREVMQAFVRRGVWFNPECANISKVARETYPAHAYKRDLELVIDACCNAMWCSEIDLDRILVFFVSHPCVWSQKFVWERTIFAGHKCHAVQGLAVFSPAYFRDIGLQYILTSSAECPMPSLLV